MKKNYLIISVLILLCFGCVQNSIYYWDGYSNSLYNLKKNPDDKTMQAHKDNVLKIIEKADYHGKKIPPGVCCEYGYYLFQENNYDEAKNYFNLEIQLYPESEKFVKLLLKDMQLKEERE